MAKKSAEPQRFTFPPGTPIFLEGTPSDTLYIVEKGQVEIHKNNKNTRVPVGIVHSGQFLGELSFLLERNHTASAMALTDVETLMISKDALKKVIETTPSWFIMLTRGIAEKLQQTNEVLKRNNIVDEQLKTSIAAIASKSKKIE